VTPVRTGREVAVPVDAVGSAGSSAVSAARNTVHPAGGGGKTRRDEGVRARRVGVTWARGGTEGLGGVGREVAVVRKVWADGRRREARWALRRWRRGGEFAFALRANASEEGRRGLLAIRLAGGAGGASVRGSGLAFENGRRHSTRGGARATSASRIAPLSYGWVHRGVRRGIGVDEAAALAIRARAREPESLTGAET
jgi:hypothetical protein